MAFGVPAMLVLVPAAGFVLMKWGPKLGRDANPGTARLFRNRLRELGPMRRPEKRVLSVFVLVAFFWVFRCAFIQEFELFGIKPFAGLTDSAIAIAGVILLFAIPSGAHPKSGSRLLDWKTAAKIPWDILLLFGGGLSLAALMQSTGLSAWLGGEFSFVAGLPPVFMIFALVAFVIFATELTSNTATAAALMPIVSAIALETGTDPALLALPIAMAASCAFMLPMATGPNAVIFASGEITMSQMTRAGFKLNLLSVPLITGLAFILSKIVL